MDKDCLRNAIRFADYARNYCRLMESCHERSSEQFFADLLRCLSDLCGAALDIPDRISENGPGGNSNTDLQSKSVIPQEERAVFSRVVQERVAMSVNGLVQGSAEREEDRSRYLMYFDDLSDVYFDLKEGLNIWDNGSSDAMAEAIWVWRFGYQTHWGYHLMDALRTTHEIVF